MPAIIVPYRNRPAYLECFLARMPGYLERLGSPWTVYISEQTDDRLFGLSTSRNVGAAVAIARENASHLVFQDVDTIPVTDVSYAEPQRPLVWFLSAGGLSIRADQFQTINGYDSRFRGWGYEDEELWDRLDTHGIQRVAWCRSEEARDAVMVNLEFNTNTKNASRRESQSYFGAPWPRFIHRLEHEGASEPWNPTPLHNKQDFYSEENKNRNRKLQQDIFSLPRTEKLAAHQANGLNQVNLDLVEVFQERENVVHIRYNSEDVLIKP